MIKKTITYKDLDDKPVTEDFWFHLNKAEVARMELKQKGGMSEYLKKMVESEDTPVIIDTFEKILKLAYGKRGEDGRSFIKSEELSIGFTQKDAYSELFMELITDSNVLIDFVKGILPSDMSDKIDFSDLEVVNVDLPNESPKLSVVSQVVHEIPVSKEVSEMTREELIKAVQRKTDEVKPVTE